MKTDNELIAEFMGIKRINSHTVIEGRSYSLLTRNYPSQLKYHNNWTWIMPVVQRITEVSLMDDAPKNCAGMALKKVCEYPITITIDKLHSKVVEFIKWYNENKQQ